MSGEWVYGRQDPHQHPHLKKRFPLVYEAPITMPCDICGKETKVNAYSKKPFARCFGCRIPPSVDPNMRKCVIPTCLTYSAKRYRACYKHRGAVVVSACERCAEVAMRAAWMTECARCFAEQAQAKRAAALEEMMFS